MRRRMNVIAGGDLGPLSQRHLTLLSRATSLGGKLEANRVQHVFPSEFVDIVGIWLDDDKQCWVMHGYSRSPSIR